MRSIKKKIGGLFIFCAAVVMLSLAGSGNVYATEKWEKAYTKKVNKVKKSDSSTKSLTLMMDKTEIPVLVIRQRVKGEEYKLTFYKYNNKKVKKLGSYKVLINERTVKVGRSLGCEYARGHSDYTTIYKLSNGKIKKIEYYSNYGGTVFEKFFKNGKKITKDSYSKVLEKAKKIKWK